MDSTQTAQATIAMILHKTWHRQSAHAAAVAVDLSFKFRVVLPGALVHVNICQQGKIRKQYCRNRGTEVLFKY